MLHAMFRGISLSLLLIPLLHFVCPFLRPLLICLDWADEKCATKPLDMSNSLVDAQLGLINTI